MDTPQRARAWLDTELAPLATCLGHASAHPDLVIALAATLDNYLRLGGAWDQAHRIHHTALAAAERTHDRRGQATILLGLADVYYLRTDHQRAQQMYERAYRLFTDLGDRRGQARTLSDLGHLYYLRGDYERARRLLEQAHRLDTDVSRGPRGVANTSLNLGRVHHRTGDHDQALGLFTQAYALYTEIGDRDGQAETLTSMGDLALDHPPAGDPHALFTRAHTLARTMNAALCEARALAGRGRCAHDVPTATTAFTQALAIYQRLGSPEAATVAGYLADLDEGDVRQ